MGNASPVAAQRPLRSRLLPLVGLALFFAAFYLYVHLRVDPALIYHRYVARWHLTDWRDGTHSLAGFHFTTMPISMYDESLGGFLGRPAGALEYAAAVMTEHFFVGWFGALLITGLALAVCLATGELIRALGGRRDHPAVFVPPGLLLLFYNQYDNPTFFALCVMVALLSAAAYVRFRPPVRWAAAVVFLGASAAVYYVAGGAYVLFAAICGLFELLRAKRPVSGAICLALSLAVPYAGSTWWHPEAGSDFWARLLPLFADENARLAVLRESGRRAISDLFGYTDLYRRPWSGFRWFTFTDLALGLTVTVLMIVVLQSIRDGRARRRDRKAGRPAPVLRRTRLDWLALPLLAGAIVVILGAALFDSYHRSILRIDYCFEHRRWNALLREARHFPDLGETSAFQHDVIMALSATGRLGDELFSYPVEPDGLLMSRHQQWEGDMTRLSRSHLEMGRVNEAEWLACNSLQGFGERPVLLRLLAMIHIVKGRTEAARVFLRVLRRYRLHEAWADRMLDRLAADPLLESDERVQRIRSRMLVTDGTVKVGGGSMDGRWLELLERNPKNRMAFEHLMTYYLLVADWAKFVGNLQRMDDFAYTTIPRHWEEAILLYRRETGQEVDLGGRTIRGETERRFEETCRLLERHRSGLAPKGLTAAEEMMEHHGDTYFCYYYLLPTRRLR